MTANTWKGLSSNLLTIVAIFAMIAVWGLCQPVGKIAFIAVSQIRYWVVLSVCMMADFGILASIISARMRSKHFTWREIHPVLISFAAFFSLLTVYSVQQDNREVALFSFALLQSIAFSSLYGDSGN